MPRGADIEIHLERRRVVEAAWEDYSSGVLPEDAPPLQFKECKRAFYAGAAALFGALTGNLSPGGDVEVADIALLEGIEEEIVAFKDAVVGGRA